MVPDKYQTFEYWDDFFLGLGYEKQETFVFVEVSPEWLWYYLKGLDDDGVRVRIGLHPKRVIDLYLSYPEKYYDMRQDIDCYELSELLLLLKALVKPELLPLCLNIKWASHIVSWELERIESI